MFLRQWDDVLKLKFQTYFFGFVHPLYVPPFTLIVLSDKHKYIFSSHKSIFSSDAISHTSIISYL